MSEIFPENNPLGQTLAVQERSLRLSGMAIATDMNVHPTCTLASDNGLSFQHNEQSVRIIRDDFPLFGFFFELADLIDRFDLAVAMTSVDHDIVCIRRHTRLVAVDRSQITAVIVRPIKVRQARVNVVGRSNSDISWQQRENFLKLCLSFAGSVQVSPAER